MARSQRYIFQIELHPSLYTAFAQVPHGQCDLLTDKDKDKDKDKEKDKDKYKVMLSQLLLRYHTANVTALAGETTSLNCRVHRLGNRCNYSLTNGCTLYIFLQERILYFFFLECILYFFLQECILYLFSQECILAKARQNPPADRWQIHLHIRPQVSPLLAISCCVVI